MLFLDSVTMKEKPGGKDEYPFSVPAMRHLERLEFKTPITFFAGNNGSGKSTLLEGLAAGMTAYAIGNHARSRVTFTSSMPRPWRRPSISPVKNIRRFACFSVRKTCLVIFVARMRMRWTIFAGSGKKP
ncbi:hypothetical protein AGR6A_Cc60056 [Agrobacterium sp. NCPPB 925]|nr:MULTISPECIES: AAA family ATPase [Agrobacterium]CUX38673.1 hypothetical protein AGR6A_Cc60056 [Agrobacterium sp. NCPPB 925]